ncbi:sensor histidine kinase [Streptomyces sp. NPDC014734]|uniref:sensor histidine kinase n=1 Tax=Streptomyces sp. NPDC014734 TaxID=3364886 RepID=UPI003702952D
MYVISRLRAGWRWWAAPELWSRRRTAGEAVLAAVLGLLAAGTEELQGSGQLRLWAVSAAVVVLSLMRRRLPVTVLVATSALAGLSGGFGLLLMVVAWSSGRRIAGAGRALGAFTASYALYTGLTVAVNWSSLRPLTEVLFTTLYFLATTLVPGLASRYWTQRRTLLHALQERNARLIRERAMIVDQARLMERQRIAQDMHDSLGHQLALISVHTGALEVDRGLTERQREVVGVLREASVHAMHELREVVGLLRDGVEAPANGAEGAQSTARGTAGIEALTAEARAAGSEAGFRRSGEVRALSGPADRAAYRIVQEALTNAYKHAPGAAIAVELRYEPDSLVVEIVNGPPSRARPAVEVVSGGQGLPGLHERARLVGGMVHTGRTRDGGFRVAGVLPYGAEGLVAGGTVGAPMVDVEDDFRQQSQNTPWGNGGPVMDWTVSERELAMGGNRRSTGGAIALGCGIGAGVLLLLALAGGFGMYFLMKEIDKATIDPSQYRSIEIGTPEDEVRDQLPDGDTFIAAGLDREGPEEPAGARCLVLMSSELGEKFNTEPVFRFCFRDGKLIEKKSYEVATR